MQVVPEPSALENSHIIPKGIYRRVKRSYGEPNGKLVTSDFTENNSFVAKHEVRQHLLCKSCEELLERNGETPFFGMMPKPNKGGFPLRSSLFSASGQRSKDGTTLWYEEDVKDVVDTGVLAHFILGVLWRCDVTNRDELKAYHGALGDKYREIVASFLLGRSDFPKGIFITVGVKSESDVNAIFTYPTKARIKSNRSECWQHQMHILGVKFAVHVGGTNFGSRGAAGLQCKGAISFVTYEFDGSLEFYSMARLISRSNFRGKRPV